MPSQPGIIRQQPRFRQRVNTRRMLTFRQFLSESPLKTATAIGLTAKIASLNRQIQNDRAASKTEKGLSSELAWLAALVGLMGVTGNTCKQSRP